MRSLMSILVLLLAAPALLAATLTGKVAKVADGDTVTVLADGQRHRVRLAGIDAPERRQRHGKASGAALRRLVLNRTVRVDWYKRDRWGRLIGTVWAARPDCRRDCPLSLDAGLVLVRAGHAWHFKRYAHEQAPDERERYAAAEQQARAERAGLWADRDSVPPWEWRRR